MIKAFKTDYNEIHPTSTGCTLVSDVGTDVKTIEDINTRMAVCQQEIADLQKEYNLLDGILTASKLMG